MKSQAGRFSHSAANAVMIARLEQIHSQALEATDTDKRYCAYTLRNLQRYRAMGIGDEVTADAITRDMWNNLHVATLEDFRFQDDPNLLYTVHALAAADERMAVALRNAGQGDEALCVQAFIKAHPLYEALAVLALDFGYPDIDRTYSLYRPGPVLSGELLEVYQRLVDDGILLERGCARAEKGPRWRAAITDQ